MTEDGVTLTMRERVILKTVSDWLFDRKIRELHRNGVTEDPNAMLAEVLGELRVLIEQVNGALKGMPEGGEK